MARDALVGQRLLRMRRVPMHRIRDRQHLHEQRLVARLAVLARQVIAERLGALEQQLLEAHEHRAPCCERLARPFGLRGARLLYGVAHVRGGRDAHFAEQLPAAGLVNHQGSLGRHRALGGFLRHRDHFSHGEASRAGCGVRPLPHGVNRSRGR